MPIGSVAMDYGNGSTTSDWSADYRRDQMRGFEDQMFNHSSNSTLGLSSQHTPYSPLFGTSGPKSFPSLVKKNPSGGYVIPSISDHGYNSIQSPYSSTHSNTCRDEFSLTLAGTAPNPSGLPSLGQISLGHYSYGSAAMTSCTPPINSMSSSRQIPLLSNFNNGDFMNYNRQNDTFDKMRHQAIVQKPMSISPSISMGAGDTSLPFNTPSSAPSISTNSRRTPGAPSDPAQFIIGDSDKEVFARKVFVGGLPIDVKEAEIYQTFSHFGAVLVDWPRRPDGKETTSLVPMGNYSNGPNRFMTGYVFLVFEEEKSVQHLVSECHREGERYYLFVSSPTMRDKPVQVRPWRLSDMDYCPRPKISMCPRRTVFIGGVPRPTRAGELSDVLDRLYGPVCYVGIDIDPELKYPKGAARVTFSTTASFVAAITGRFVHIPHAENPKRVEIKPYVMDEQMCDECEGRNCSARYAPYFCGDVGCLQYYCETCWDDIHYGGQCKKRSQHKPLVRLGDQTKLLARPPHHNIRSPGFGGVSRQTRSY